MTQFVVCFDFGTSYSGFAYAHISDSRIKTFHEWEMSTTDYPKNLSAILYDDKTQQALEWGHKAEAIYFDKAQEARQNKVPLQYTLFKMFKMSIFDEKIAKTLKLQSTGKYLPKEKVISDYLKFMNQFCLSFIQSKHNITLRNDEIRWILTVPAIWSDTNKKFMKKCAVNAGMIPSVDVSEERFDFALEPEAAAIYCLKENYLDFKNGEVALIVDAGGGTIDITTFRLFGDNIFEEVCAGGGGAQGSLYLNELFIDYCSKVLGETVMEKMKTEKPEYILMLKKAFETAKRRAHDGTTTVSVDLPSQIAKYIIRLNPDFELDDISLPFNGNGITIRKVHEQVLLPKLYEFLDTQIQTCKNAGYSIKYIVCVGGFSESKALVNIIREKYTTINVLNPLRGGEAVVYGGVYFGLKSSKFVRKARRSYGISTSCRFIKGQHSEQQKFVHSEEKVDYASNVFSVFIKKNESVNEENEVEKIFYPLYNSQQAVTFSLYSCEDDTPPMHIANNNCTLVEQFTLNVGDQVQDRTSVGMKVVMNFGKTNLQVRATNLKTAEKVESSVEL